MSNIEEYTKNFKFMIPEFNVATWHTEIKENFKAIDALIANFVQSQQYQGAWKQVTQYYVGDLVYISDENSNNYGGLFKVLVDHITTSDDFDTFLGNNPTYYDLQGEMGAQVAALHAQDWAEKTDGKVIINESPVDYSSKAYAIGGTGTETNNAKYFKEQSELARDTILEDPGFIAIKADFLGNEYIKAVAENEENINTVAINITNINAVVENEININAVASNISNINTVAEIVNDISEVANISQKVSSVANNEININKVSNDLNNIDAVANELSDIMTKANKSLNNLDATGQAVINNKVNLNLNNMNPSTTSKKTIVGWGMPDYSAIVSRSKDTSYTADSYGFVLGEFSGVGSEGKITINGKSFNNSGGQTTITAMYPVSTGDTYSFTANSGYNYAFWFIPCKGV